jgi:hypothetical protein
MQYIHFIFNDDDDGQDNRWGIGVGKGMRDNVLNVLLNLNLAGTILESPRGFT